MLHRQLQQLPQAGQSGADLRNTWFRISGILRSLRRYEDFCTVLPILDLVRSKFPTDIQQKLHDVEFQSGTDFDLHQIIHHLDHIIASREKCEDTTTLEDSYSIHSSHRSRKRSGSRSQSPAYHQPSCAFCGSRSHETRAYVWAKVTLVAVVAVHRADVAQAITLSFCVDIVHEKNANGTVHVGTTLIGRADTTMIATSGITSHRRGTDTRLEVHLTTDAEAKVSPTVNARGLHRGIIVDETIDHGLTLQQGVIVVHPTGFTFVRHAETAVTIAP
ncbi:hypothetical protein V3C99_008578 [Haemonchus contortus]|uniref:Uncharacterized protein n=1 Tax=Haemonchus contortus TaxID=6289 RepID=A0A7I4YMM8_HAECO